MRGGQGLRGGLSFECLLPDPGEQKSVFLLLGARTGFLSLKKKGSTVFVLHQLGKEGLNSNAKAIRHRGGTRIRGAFPLRLIWGDRLCQIPNLLPALRGPDTREDARRSRGIPAWSISSPFHVNIFPYQASPGPLKRQVSPNEQHLAF